jgi:hypothetical protein
VDIGKKITQNIPEIKSNSYPDVSTDDEPEEREKIEADFIVKVQRKTKNRDCFQELFVRPPIP